MPNVAGVRALCPVKITSEEWACCGTKGITILLTAFVRDLLSNRAKHTDAESAEIIGECWSSWFPSRSCT